MTGRASGGRGVAGGGLGCFAGAAALSVEPLELLEVGTAYQPIPPELLSRQSPRSDLSPHDGLRDAESNGDFFGTHQILRHNVSIAKCSVRQKLYTVDVIGHKRYY